MGHQSGPGHRLSAWQKLHARASGKRALSGAAYALWLPARHRWLGEELSVASWTDYRLCSPHVYQHLVERDTVRERPDIRTHACEQQGWQNPPSPLPGPREAPQPQLSCIPTLTAPNASCVPPQAPCTVGEGCPGCPLQHAGGCLGGGRCLSTTCKAGRSTAARSLGPPALCRGAPSKHGQWSGPRLLQ